MVGSRMMIGRQPGEDLSCRCRSCRIFSCSDSGCFVECRASGSVCSVSEALSHVVAEAASSVHVLCLLSERSRTLWMCLRFLKALIRDASKDVPMSDTRLVRRRLRGRESANHHCSNVASAIVRTLENLKEVQFFKFLNEIMGRACFS